MGGCSANSRNSRREVNNPLLIFDVPDEVTATHGPIILVSEINLPAGPVRFSNLLSTFTRWSSREDDIFKSTLHRVVNRSGLQRYSIPLFFGTDYEVLLEVSDSIVIMANIDPTLMINAAYTYMRVPWVPCQVWSYYCRRVCQIETRSYLCPFVQRVIK